MEEGLVEKAKKIVANIKEGNAYNMNLEAIRIIDELIKELEKYQSRKDG